MTGGSSGGEVCACDTLEVGEQDGGAGAGAVATTGAAGVASGMGLAGCCEGGVSSLRLLRMTGAKSLHTGKLPGLRLQLAVVAINDDSTSCLLAVWFKT